MPKFPQELQIATGERITWCRHHSFERAPLLGIGSQIFIDERSGCVAREGPVFLLGGRPACGLGFVVVEIVNYYIVRGVVEPRLLQRLTEFGSVVTILHPCGVSDQPRQRRVDVGRDGRRAVRSFLPQNLR